MAGTDGPVITGLGERHGSAFLRGAAGREGEAMVHQVTGGLQWIHRNWVLEGGVVQDLNGPEVTRTVVSVRLHF